MFSFALACGTLHASFGRASSLKICRRLSTVCEDAEQLVKARLALEIPSSFSILAGSDGFPIMYVCSVVGVEVHQLNACLWPSNDVVKRHRLHELKEYHERTFSEHVLTTGSLCEDELEIWRSIP